MKPKWNISISLDEEEKNKLEKLENIGKSRREIFLEGVNLLLSTTNMKKE